LQIYAALNGISPDDIEKPIEFTVEGLISASSIIPTLDETNSCI